MILFGLPFLLAGYLIKYLGLGMVAVGDVLINIGTWIVRAPVRLWRWIRRK